MAEHLITREQARELQNWANKSAPSSATLMIGTAGTEQFTVIGECKVQRIEYVPRLDPAR